MPIARRTPFTTALPFDLRAGPSGARVSSQRAAF
jgi:hypothetical protein